MCIHVTGILCRYPHLACELLTCEVEAIVTSLSGSEHLMGLLWAFLDKQEPLNPLVGRYMCKVFAYVHVHVLVFWVCLGLKPS